MGAFIDPYMSIGVDTFFPLDQDHEQHPKTGANTDEGTLYTKTIKGGTMGAE